MATPARVSETMGQRMAITPSAQRDHAALVIQLRCLGAVHVQFGTPAQESNSVRLGCLTLLPHLLGGDRGAQMPPSSHR
jgi:hypothetical protein